MNIDIICPLYNAFEYIDNLHNSLLKQKKVNINQISYILTESKDQTEKYLIDHKLNYQKIKKYFKKIKKFRCLENVRMIILSWFCYTWW